MAKSKRYKISEEVYKYPYCGNRFESKEFLSEKICCYTIKIRQKIFKKVERLIISGDFIFSFTSGVVPSHAIGLPISTQTQPIIRSVGLSKKEIIAQVIKERPAKSDFTEKEIEKLPV